jgi:hypothetical protein
MNQSPSWEANRFSAGQEIPAFCEIRRFITAYTRALHLSLSWVSSIQLLRSYQSISPGPRVSVWILRNTIRFYGEELLARRPTTKLEDHPFSAVRDCLSNIFAATLHIGGRSSTRNPRTPHAAVTGTHLSRPLITVYKVLITLFFGR